MGIIPRRNKAPPNLEIKILVPLLDSRLPIRAYPVREVRCSPLWGLTWGVAGRKKVWRWRDIRPGDPLVFHQSLPIPREPGQARHSALPARSTQVLCQRPADGDASSPWRAGKYPKAVSVVHDPLEGADIIAKSPPRKLAGIEDVRLMNPLLSSC